LPVRIRPLIPEKQVLWCVYNIDQSGEHKRCSTSLLGLYLIAKFASSIGLFSCRVYSPSLTRRANSAIKLGTLLDSVL
jgi:hypothetical protein